MFQNRKLSFLELAVVTFIVILPNANSIRNQNNVEEDSLTEFNTGICAFHILAYKTSSMALKLKTCKCTGRHVSEIIINYNSVSSMLCWISSIIQLAVLESRN